MFDFFPFSRLSYVWETTSLHSHVSLGKTQELHRLRRKVMPNACDMENPIQMNYQNRAWHFNKGEKEQSGGKNKPEPLRMEFDKRGTNSNSTESCVNKLLTSLFGLTRCSKTNKKKKSRPEDLRMLFQRRDLWASWIHADSGAQPDE